MCKLNNVNVNGMVVIWLSDRESYIKVVYVSDCKNWEEVEKWFDDNGLSEVVGWKVVEVSEENFKGLMDDLYMGGDMDYGLSGDYDFDEVLVCKVSELLDNLD